MSPGQYVTPRTQGGFPLQPIPSGAKAAAYETWIARGGGIRATGAREGAYRREYRQGPMKGLTQAEAQARFEKMWHAAPDSVKEKYYNRDSGMQNFAPSERPMAQAAMEATQKAIKSGRLIPGISNQGEQEQSVGTPTGFTLDQDPADRRASMTPPPQRSAVTPERKAGYGTAVNPERRAAQEEAAIGTDEERARVASMVQEGQGFATAGTNDSGMAAAAAMERANKQMVDSGKAGQYGSLYENIGPDGLPKQSNQGSGMALGGSPASMYGGTIRTPEQSRSPEVQKQLEAKQEAERAARQKAWGEKKAADAAALAKSERARLNLPDPAPAQSQPAAPAQAPVTGTAQAGAEGVAPVANTQASGPTVDQMLFSKEDAAMGYSTQGGPGMELIGVRRGKQIFAPVAEVYGQQNVQGKGIEQIRADYQARNQPQEAQPKFAVPRGPASDPEGWAKREREFAMAPKATPVADPNKVAAYQAAVNASKNYSGSDAEYAARAAAPDQIYKSGNELDQIAMRGAAMQRAKTLNEQQIPGVTKSPKRMFSRF